MPKRVVLFMVFILAGCGSGQRTTPEVSQAQPEPYYKEQGYNDYGYYNPYTQVQDIGQMPQGTVGAIFSFDGQTFLGYVTEASHPESICNPSGMYGSPSSPYSIFSPASYYGNSGSAWSAYNPTAQTPPVMYAWDGVNLSFMDFVTKNPHRVPRFDPDDLAILCR